MNAEINNLPAGYFAGLSKNQQEIVMMLEPDRFSDPQGCINSTFNRIESVKSASTPKQWLAVSGLCGNANRRGITLLQSRGASYYSLPEEYEMIARVARDIGANNIKLYMDKDGNRWIDLERILTKEENLAIEIALKEIELEELKKQTTK